jgi:hypothetical protein
MMHDVHDFRDGTQYAMNQERRGDIELVRLMHDSVDGTQLWG